LLRLENKKPTKHNAVANKVIAYIAILDIRIAKSQYGYFYLDSNTIPTP